jgi:hypothetical protein
VAPRPVFIHSEWRTSSTYVWARLGRTGGGMAFHEPFHETLGHLTPGIIDSMRAEGWASGHPELEAPYFVEYAPLLEQPLGVHGFQSRFSYEDYYALDPDLVAAQSAYLQGLLDLAASQGKRAVLGFCRSLGRMPWLVKAFPDALHVRLERDPVSQWMSGFRQFTGGDNAYFLAGYVVTAATAYGQPYLQAVCRDLGIPEPPSTDPFAAYGFYLGWVREQTPVLLFRAFWHVHQLNLRRAGELAHLVIEVDRLGTPGYRDEVTTSLAAYGIETSFDDASTPMHDGGELAPMLAQARDEADAFTEAWQAYGAAL